MFSSVMLLYGEAVSVNEGVRILPCVQKKISAQGSPGWDPILNVEGTTHLGIMRGSTNLGAMARKCRRMVMLSANAKGDFVCPGGVF